MVKIPEPQPHATSQVSRRTKDGKEAVATAGQGDTNLKPLYCKYLIFGSK